MRLQGLKTKLTINLAFFLLLAILLTDFVVVRIVEKSWVQERIRHGRELAATLSRSASSNLKAASSEEGRPLQTFHSKSRPLMVHVLISGKEGLSRDFGQMPGQMAFNPADANRAVIKSGESKRLFLGSTWGVFWKQHKYAAITEPWMSSPDSGATTVIVPLEDIYRKLQASQKVVAFYGLINLFILLGLLRFRLDRIVLRPIQRFIRITEQVNSSEQFPVYAGQRNNEFSQLSNAIQQMARRIEADKEQIENSLNSLKVAHNDLKAAQKEMIRAEKLASVGRLSAGIAHEIGNPIGIVLGYLSMLKNQASIRDDHRAADYIERSESEINRINQIIRQLLDFSRAAPGEQEAVSVHGLIDDVARMFADQPMMRNITLSRQLEAETDQVFVDYQQLRQVLVNLLINAADSIGFSENAGFGDIRMRTRELPADSANAVNNSDTIEISVVDNGCGIAGKDIDNIFDPFYTTKEPGKGTGLGLSVSYMIIEQFGGTIAAKSERNKGTTMAVYLPRAADSPELNESTDKAR